MRKPRITPPFYRRDHDHRYGPRAGENAANLDQRSFSLFQSKAFWFGQAPQQQREYAAGEGRDREGDAPGVEVGSEAPERGGEGRADGGGRHQVREGLLSGVHPNRIADVYEGCRYHRREESAHERTSGDQDTQVRGQRRDHARQSSPEKRKAHHAHPSYPVREHPPYGLHHPIEQIVETCRRRNFGKRRPEGGSDGNEHRRDREPIEGAEEGREL